VNLNTCILYRNVNISKLTINVKKIFSQLVVCEMTHNHHHHQREQLAHNLEYQQSWLQFDQRTPTKYKVTMSNNLFNSVFFQSKKFQSLPSLAHHPRYATPSLRWSYFSLRNESDLASFSTSGTDFERRYLIINSRRCIPEISTDYWCVMGAGRLWGVGVTLYKASFCLYLE